MPAFDLRAPRVLPSTELTLPRTMPQSSAWPVRSVPQSSPRGVHLMPQPSSRAVRINRAPHTADNPAGRDELRRRGTTVIADKVFEKIAGQAASEVTASRGRSGGVLGIGSDADSNARPKVDVDLSADSADFDIAAGIAYPGSIRTAAQQIRDRVTRTVQDLTGVSVHRVDIDVTFLTTAFADSGSNSSRKQVLR